MLKNADRVYILKTCVELIKRPITFIIIVTLIFFNYRVEAHDKNYDLLIENQSTKVEELRVRVEALEKAMLHLKQNQENFSYRPASESTSVTENGIASVKVPATIADDKTCYDLALASLKEGNYTEAENEFADFIQKYPSSKLRENAIFWQGESFYRREDYNRAAMNYSKSYKEYPKGSKAPDSLLKLSLSLGFLNKKIEACKILNKLDKEFPNREVHSKNRSQAAKTEFNCEN